ncbi:hypothetical protein HK101_011867 [Irineochytrium annulatum]|nr:hypothetical protein HK101_011867 [Irineochytrium annulatum]
MDLGTIMKKCENGEYDDPEEVERDFRLMIRNCKTFNPPGSAVHVAGKELESVFDKLWAGAGIRAGGGGGAGAKRQKSTEADGANGSAVRRGEDPAAAKSAEAGPSVVRTGETKIVVKIPLPGKKKEEPTLPELTYDERKELFRRIAELTEGQIATVFAIVKTDPLYTSVHTDEEIELEIDRLQKHTQSKLYHYVVLGKVYPEPLKVEVPNVRPAESPELKGKKPAGAEKRPAEKKPSEKKSTPAAVSKPLVKPSRKQSPPVPHPPHSKLPAAGGPIPSHSKSSGTTPKPSLSTAPIASHSRSGAFPSHSRTAAGATGAPARAGDQARPTSANGNGAASGRPVPRPGTTPTLKKPGIATAGVRRPAPGTAPPKQAVKRETVDIFKYVEDSAEKKQKEKEEEEKLKAFAAEKARERERERERDRERAERERHQQERERRQMYECDERGPPYAEDMHLKEKAEEKWREEKQSTDWLDMERGPILMLDFEKELAALEKSLGVTGYVQVEFARFIKDI